MTLRVPAFASLALVVVVACGGEEPITAPAPIVAPQPVANPTNGPGVPLPTPGVIASNFGTVTLAPGFAPDPHVAHGSSGGQIQASNLNPQCAGWISQQPDHVLSLTQPIPGLRVVVNGGSTDTTLVVQQANGQYLCNDDTDGLHPVVQGMFLPGAHRVWVGTYTRGERASYTLGFSQLGHVTPTTLVGGAPSVPAVPAPQLDVTGSNSNFQDVALAPGFRPSPHVVTGSSGGSVQANGLGGNCVGHISATPDHLFTALGHLAHLSIAARSSEDITLVVRRPDGTFLCNDDSEGTDPMVSGPFPPGVYRVWVGSYSSGSNGAYTLGFSEAPLAPSMVGGGGVAPPPPPPG